MVAQIVEYYIKLPNHTFLKYYFFEPFVTVVFTVFFAINLGIYSVIVYSYCTFILEDHVSLKPFH